MSGVGRRAEPSLGAAAGQPPGVQVRPRASSGVGTVLFALAVAALVVYGFLHRDENWITPERGLGYAFGIVGSVLMLILLAYPFRKRFRWMRGIGRLPSWLKFHMFLGIVGPTLIIFHANFRLGATNSNVALLAMLTVVASGIVGRYIYGKTHSRLSGELRSLHDLRAETQAAREHLQFDFANHPDLQQRLQALEARILDPDHGVLSSAWLYVDFSLSMGSHRTRLLRLLNAAMDAEALQRGPERHHMRAPTTEARRYLSIYLQKLRRAAEFRFYERLFAMWHVLHVPLLFLLIAAAVVHIAAVHLY